MRKIILSLITIAGVVALGIGASRAFFSDTETSTGNTFVAGDIDLKIDNHSYAFDYNIPQIATPSGVFMLNPNTTWELKDLVAEKFFNFSDLKPGDYGEDTISVHVGSNDAWMCASARITSDLDNTITEPEDEVDGPTVGDGTADGDLDSGLNFAFWKDDGDNVFESDESTFLTGTLSQLGQQGKIALADTQGGIMGGNEPIPGNSTFYIGKIWCYGTLTQNPVTQDGHGNVLTPITGTGWKCDGSAVGNIGQTDSVTGDLKFYAVQSRNNTEFTCDSWNPGWQS